MGQSRNKVTSFYVLINGVNISAVSLGAGPTLVINGTPKVNEKKEHNLFCNPQDLECNIGDAHSKPHKRFFCCRGGNKRAANRATQKVQKRECFRVNIVMKFLNPYLKKSHIQKAMITQAQQ